MKTIFEYAPTIEELVDLFGYNEKTDAMAYGFSIVALPVKEYDARTTKEEKLLDVAQLLELRGQRDEAIAIWKQIPDVERQYRSGFDNKAWPVVT
jgi:hypothetical protein